MQACGYEGGHEAGHYTLIMQVATDSIVVVVVVGERVGR